MDKSWPEFNLKNAKLTYLDHSDRFNLKTKVVSPSVQKLRGQKIDPNADNFLPFFKAEAFYPDILADTVIVNAMSHLIDSKQQTLIGLAFNAEGLAAQDINRKSPALGFEFRLRKGADSLGYFTGAWGGEDYTIINIYLDVVPISMARPLYKMRERKLPRAASRLTK